MSIAHDLIIPGSIVKFDTIEDFRKRNLDVTHEMLKFRQMRLLDIQLQDGEKEWKAEGWDLLNEKTFYPPHDLRHEMLLRVVQYYGRRGHYTVEKQSSVIN